MQFNGHRGSGSRPGNGAWLTAEQQAAARQRALEWRQEWRAEAEGRNNGEELQAKAPPSQAPRKPDNSRAAFAAGIARAEFGRFYWDAKKHGVAGTARKPRPAK